jgi:putative ABC transport system permease protein
LDVRFIDSLVGRFIAQFAAIPTIVGILSLIAAAVIMANTIALSTLERRRQIGILKAIGLKSGRVLRVMLIESTLIGLMSAGLGLGLSQLGLWLFTYFTGQVIPFPRSAQVVALVLVIAAVVISWVSTFLSANVAVRERVMNVLRYE